MPNVTIDAAGSVASGSTSPLDDISLTIGSGSNRALIVAITQASTSSTITSVVWDPTGANQALTAIVGKAAGSRRCDLYGLVNPASGNLTLRVSWSGGSKAFKFCGMAVTNADQTGGATTFRNATSASDASGPSDPSLAITSATGDMTVDVAQAGSVDTISTPTKTQIWLNTTGTLDGGGSRAAGAATVTHAWTVGGIWSQVGCSIKSSADITIALTGNAATGAVGSFGVGERSFPITGNLATGAVGTLGKTSLVAKALTGNAGTGAVGTMSNAGWSKAVTGNSATGAVGTLGPVIAPPFTGNQATGAVGTLTMAERVQALAGVAGTGAAGTVVAGITQPITGNLATGSVDSLSVTASLALSGVAGTGAAGDLSPAFDLPVVGNAATCAVGSLLASYVIGLVGVEGVGDVGTIRTFHPSIRRVTLIFRDQAFMLPPRLPVRPMVTSSVLGYANTNLFGVPAMSYGATLSPTGYAESHVFGSPVAFVALHPPAGVYGAPGVITGLEMYPGNAFGHPTATGGQPVQTLRAYGGRQPNYFGAATVIGAQLLRPNGWDDRTLRTVAVGAGYVVVGDRFGTPTATSFRPLVGLDAVAIAQFEPRPPGATRPVSLSSGFNNSLALYTSGGANRLLMQESFGYSTLSLANPAAPTALAYRNNEDSPDGVGHSGDGQSNVYSMGVSDDGARGVFSLGNTADSYHTICGAASSSKWTQKGSFAPNRGLSTLVQHSGSRYIAYVFKNTGVSACDITTIPATFSIDNLTSESTGWSGGGQAILAGNFIVYRQGGGTISIYDATTPGSVGDIVGAYPSTTITTGDLAGAITGCSAVWDDVTQRLWVLAEIARATGGAAPRFQLIGVTAGLAKTVYGATSLPDRVRGVVDAVGRRALARVPQQQRLPADVGQAHRAVHTVPAVHHDGRPVGHVRVQVLRHRAVRVRLRASGPAEGAEYSGHSEPLSVHPDDAGGVRHHPGGRVNEANLVIMPARRPRPILKIRDAAVQPARVPRPS